MNLNDWHIFAGLRLLEHEERAERQVRLLLRAGEGREQQALARAAASGDPDLVLQILLYLRNSDKYKSKSPDFLLLIRPVPLALNLYLRVRSVPLLFCSVSSEGTLHTVSRVQSRMNQAGHSNKHTLWFRATFRYSSVDILFYLANLAMRYEVLYSN